MGGEYDYDDSGYDYLEDSLEHSVELVPRVVSCSHQLKINRLKHGKDLFGCRDSVGRGQTEMYILLNGM